VLNAIGAVRLAQDREVPIHVRIQVRLLQQAAPI